VRRNSAMSRSSWAAGSAAAVRRAAWRRTPAPRAILERYGRPMAADDQELALAELIEAAGTSPLAAAILDETAQYLGAGIGTLINLFNPERVILGGWAGLLLGGRLLSRHPRVRAAAFACATRSPPPRSSSACSVPGGRARRGDASNGVLPQTVPGRGPSRAMAAEPGSPVTV